MRKTQLRQTAPAIDPGKLDDPAVQARTEKGVLSAPPVPPQEATRENSEAHYPWNAPGVRPDVTKAFTLRLSEPVSMQIDWLVQEGKAKSKHALIMDLINGPESLATLLAKHGADT